MALLHEQLLTGEFAPSKGNALLVGDAAGLIFPITFEGIGSALRSGILAAESIAKAAKTGQPASTCYLKELQPVLETIRRLCVVQDELKAAAVGGARVLATALSDAYQETLTIQGR